MTTAELLAIVRDAKSRDAVARAYRETYRAGPHDINWPLVSSAIRKRFGAKGLEQIKQWAHRQERLGGE